MGQLDDDRVAAALSRIAAAAPSDVWTRAAVLSASVHRPARVLAEIAAWPADRPGRAELLAALASLGASVGEPADVFAAALAGGPMVRGVAAGWQFSATASLLDALD